MVKEELCNSTMHLNFNQLVSIVEDLTGPEGCPWDKKQTHKSLAPQILEEVYELFESIDESNPNKIMEDLGDILLQIIFHSVLLKKLNKLDISDVCKNISEKMITRHPHVFGDKESNLDIKTSEDVELKCESLKRLEKDKNRSIVSIRNTIPKNTTIPDTTIGSNIFSNFLFIVGHHEHIHHQYNHHYHNIHLSFQRKVIMQQMVMLLLLRKFLKSYLWYVSFCLIE